MIAHSRSSERLESGARPRARRTLLAGQRQRIVIALLAACYGLAAPLGARAEPSDFVDSRLTVTFGDDDIFTSAVSSSDTPLIGFGDRPGYQLFFDNLNTRYSTRETLTHLVLYRKLPGFWSSVTTEAALVALLALQHDYASPVVLTDAGSYLRVSYAPWGEGEGSFSLTAFPFDSDRFRMGYLYRISAGSNTFYPKLKWIGAPGAKLQLDHGSSFYYVGFKAVPGYEEEKEGDSATAGARYETQYTVLAGGGVDLLDDTLRIEGGAGYFEQGTLGVSSVRGERFLSAGGAARVVWHQDLAIEDSIDYALYTSDPNRPFLAFRPVVYRPGEVGFLVSLEGIGLAMRLADPVTSGQTTFQGSWALALQGRLQVGYWRLEATAFAESLTFLLRNRFSLAPYVAIDPGSEVSPHLFFSATSDYHFPDPHLTLALSAGVQLPASLTTTLTSGSISFGTHGVVFDETGGMSILPEGVEASPVFHSRLQLRWDISQILYSLVWVQYGYDANTAELQVNTDWTLARVARDPHRLGLGVAAAARF